MEFPHDHEWIDGERQTDHLPPSPDYKITWDYNPSSEFGFDLSDYYNPPTGENLSGKLFGSIFLPLNSMR